MSTVWSGTHKEYAITKIRQLNEHWTWQQTQILSMSCKEHRVWQEVHLKIRKWLKNSSNELKRAKIFWVHLNKKKKVRYDAFKISFRIPHYALQMQAYFCLFHLYKASWAHFSCMLWYEEYWKLDCKVCIPVKQTDLCFSVLLNHWVCSAKLPIVMKEAVLIKRHLSKEINPFTSCTHLSSPPSLPRSHLRLAFLFPLLSSLFVKAKHICHGPSCFLPALLIRNRLTLC